MAVEVLSARVRVSDPKPGWCSACWAGANENTVFVDFDAAFDSGQQVEERDGIVVSRVSGDDLHLCGSCVKAAAEALALKPERHTNQMREIRRLELDNERLRDENLRLRDLVGKGGPDGK